MTKLAVRDMPTSGKPAELLAAAGIDADAHRGRCPRARPGAGQRVGRTSGCQPLTQGGSVAVPRPAAGLPLCKSRAGAGTCTATVPVTRVSRWSPRLLPRPRRSGEARARDLRIADALLYAWRMAVVIATNLRKELAGDLLFDGVTFKVERRERLALSGPNGAGKTTLLRMLAGQTEIHGGELAFQKGTRVALHDQRPPLELGLTLREYAFSGAGDVIAAEEELARLEQAMAAGDGSPATLARYGEAQALLEHAGGYAWRERAVGVAARARLRRRRSRPPADDLLRRGAHARLARASARPAAPTCCSSTSPRTTSTSSAWSGSSASCSRWTRPSSWSRTTAGSSRR